MILADQVARLRAGLIDGPYGNQERDWGAATSETYPAEVQPASVVGNSSTEDVVDQQRVITRWRLVLGANADLEATDRIVWDGVTYEVDGDVERWKRRGVLHHLEAVLMRVEQGV